MTGEVVEIEETDEYYVIPEAAIRFDQHLRLGEAVEDLAAHADRRAVSR